MSYLNTATDTLLPGLLPASFRGCQIWVVNTESNLGRRISVQYFPGTDTKAISDRGKAEGKVKVSAFVIGDDYVAQANSLRSALQSPGAGTYICPWRGQLKLIPTADCSIKFDVKELRVARLQLNFESVPADDFLGGILGTLGGLLSAITNAFGVAGSLAGDMIGVTASALAVVTSSRSAVAKIVTITNDVLGSSSLNVDLAPDMETMLRPLGEVDGMTPATMGFAVVNTFADLTDLMMPRPAPALAPRVEATFDAIPPQDGAALLLGMAQAIDAAPTMTVAEASMLIAAEMAAVLGGAKLTTQIRFESRQDAADWRDRVDAALSNLAVKMEAMVSVSADPALAALAQISATRSALARDLNEAIGRLPATRRIAPRTPSAWLFAQALVGDDPAKLEPFVADLVRRNGIEHQGALGASPLEVLLS